MKGPWQKAYDQALGQPSFLDLTDSQFHQNGLVPDRSLFERGFSRYLDQRMYTPDSRGALPAREAISQFYRSAGALVESNNVVITAGTSEAYALLFSSFAQAGDEVLLPRPGYPLFEHLAAYARLSTRFYDQNYALGWQPDPAEVEAQIGPKTRFLAVISPNNPTGQTLEASVIVALGDLCERRNLILIVDEVFDSFWTGLEAMPRPSVLCPRTKTMTLNGISKRFGSPDLKLAWIALSGPRLWCRDTGNSLEMINDAFLSANSFSQFILPELFAAMDPWQQKARDLLDKNRKQAEGFLARTPGVSGLVPRGGIHGLWRFDGLPADLDDEKWATDLIRTEALALHPGFFYDVHEPGVWLVYSLLKEPAAFAEGLVRLEQRFSLLRKSVAGPG